MRRYRTFLFDSSRWEGFPHRADDIVISAPGKAGTTWMQMLCALLVFQTPEFDEPLTALSPWLDVLLVPKETVLEQLEAQSHRRFIKTHTPLDGLPLDPRVTYICVARDPREISLSMDNHAASMDAARFLELRQSAVGLDDLADFAPPRPEPPHDDPVARFRFFIEHVPPAPDGRQVLRISQDLGAVLHHFLTFWQRRDDPNVALFHFSDLRADLDGEMRRLARVLGIEVAEDRWRELVEAATFDAMRRRAEHLAPEVTHGLWPEPSRFFHRGETGGWQAVLGPEDLARYEERIAELVPSDLARWVHGGWRALQETSDATG